LGQSLRANPHYDYCRKIGQLEMPQVFRMAPGQERRYFERLASLGQRLGDIKPAGLIRLEGWEEWFEPAHADRAPVGE
jgi:hypothetical protein